jgi:hypothetical protein
MIEKLYKRFVEIYGFIYDSKNDVLGYDFMIDYFFSWLKKSGEFKAIVNEFAEYRKDVITSDREAAAFMFAFTELYRIED